MEQVHIEYREMDIWKVNEFNFLSKEVEEFASKWSQNLVNVSPSYFKRKTLLYIQIIYSSFHLFMMMCSELNVHMVKYVHIFIMFLMHVKLMGKLTISKV